MKYEEMWKKAESNKTAKNLTPDFFKFEKKGDAVTGKLLSTAPVSSSLSEGTYQQYLFETDEGLVKCGPGGALDKELAATIKIGGVYRIEYQGKIPLKGGRQVNRFKVFELEPGDLTEVTDEDVPF